MVGLRRQTASLAQQWQATGEEQDTSLFKPGQSGNPNGRPKGALNKASQAIRALSCNAARFEW
jgi:hypothetical protein